MTVDAALLARARVHAALGDLARLSMVDALMLGDASPGEIGEEFGLATNLVTHHVRVLEAAGIVRRTRSEADRRRTYLRLEPRALASLTPPPRAATGRVAFVCASNAARSQLAAILWQHRAGGPAVSAGTRPAAAVHPRTVAVARRHGLSVDVLGTAHVDEVLRADDLIVTVCDNAHEAMPAPHRPRLHWSVPDPVRAGTDQAFEAAFSELAARVDRLARARP